MQENKENQEPDQSLGQDEKEGWGGAYSYGSPSGNEPYGQGASGNYQYGQNGYGQNRSENYGQYQNGAGNYQQYYQNGYGNYQQNGGAGGGNGFGIASMILGIVSLALFCTCINIPLAIAAVVFGVLHLIRRPDNKVFGIVGIVTSVISVVAFILMAVLMWSPLVAYYNESGSQIQRPFGHDYDDYDDDYDRHDGFDFDFDFPFPDDSGYGLPGSGGF